MPVLMKISCAEKTLREHIFFLAREFISYLPTPTMSQRTSSPFLSSPDKQSPGHLFLSQPMSQLGKVFPMPRLWTKSRTCFSFLLGIHLILRRMFNILMTLFGYLWKFASIWEISAKTRASSPKVAFGERSTPQTFIYPRSNGRKEQVSGLSLVWKPCFSSWEIAELFL